MIIDSHQHIMLPTEYQLQKMKEAGIDKTILFCTTPHPERANNLEELKQEMSKLYMVLAGANNKEEITNRLINNIHDLTDVLAKYPDQFLGFGSVPLGLSSDEACTWISKHIVGNHLLGIGEFTPGTDEQMALMHPVFEAASHFSDCPIWIHTFNPVTKNGIQILMNLCRSYPSVPVIWGHMGGYHWMEVIDFVKTAPNSYLDLSASFSTLAVKMAMTELPDKCLFSSDAPYGEALLSRQLIEYVSPSGAITEMVLGENIIKLLGL